MKITKRNGNMTMYDDEKITRAVAVNIADRVFSRLTKENEIIATKDVRDCVYEILTERGYPKTAKAYAEYKK